MPQQAAAEQVSPAVIELRRQADALERIATMLGEQIGPELRRTARALTTVAGWEPGRMLAELALALTDAQAAETSLRAALTEWERTHG